MFIPGNYNFSVYCGSTFCMPIIWEQNNGEALDFTGYAAVLQAKSRHGSEVVLELESGGGIEITPEEGKLLLTIDADASLEIEPQLCTYELRLIDAEGRPYRALQGTIEFVEEISL